MHVQVLAGDIADMVNYLRKLETENQGRKELLTERDKKIAELEKELTALKCADGKIPDSQEID